MVTFFLIFYLFDVDFSCFVLPFRRLPYCSRAYHRRDRETLWTALQPYSPRTARAGLNPGRRHPSVAPRRASQPEHTHRRLKRGSAPAAFPPFPGAGPEPEMLTIPFNVLFKSAHVQLRLPSLPFRDPDPSQTCLHFQLTFSLKWFIFSSGCLPSLSGSRTQPRNAYISFHFSL